MWPYHTTKILAANTFLQTQIMLSSSEMQTTNAYHGISQELIFNSDMTNGFDCNIGRGLRMPMIHFGGLHEGFDTGDFVENEEEVLENASINHFLRNDHELYEIGQVNTLLDSGYDDVGIHEIGMSRAAFNNMMKASNLKKSEAAAVKEVAKEFFAAGAEATK